MTAWFWQLPIEQRAWALLGAAAVLTGLAVGLYAWAEARYQRHRDRVERAGSALTELLAVVPSETVEMRRLRTTDTIDHPKQGA